MIPRRAFIGGMVSTAVLLPLTTHAKAPVKAHRIGVLMTTTQVAASHIVAAFADLVRQKVDVIVSSSQGPALAAKRATTTIPIVMVNTTDPVEVGLVASLARPGGNATGLSQPLTPEIP